MKILKKAWDEFVYGGHLVGVGDVIAIYALAQVLGVDATWDFLVIVYLLPFSVNVFNRIKEIKKDSETNLERSKVLEKSIRIYTTAAFLSPLFIFLLIFVYGNLASALLVMGIFMIGAAYTLFLKNVTRYLLGLKNFVLAITYSLLIFLLILYYEQPFSLAFILIFLFYFIRVFINTVFCDIKDMESDKKEKLKTFSLIYGKEFTTKVLMTLNFLSLALIIFGVYIEVLPVYSIALILTVFYAFYYLRNLNSKQFTASFYFNVLVDAEFIFWLPYIILGKTLL